jgi:hypothetical protein
MGRESKRDVKEALGELEIVRSVGVVEDLDGDNGWC